MADQSLSLLQIDNNKVGIGTARPTHKLHIYGSDASFLLQDPTANSLLEIKGAGNGYINAGISLQSTNGSHDRGMGIFMHDAGADTEWFAGTPYANGDQYQIGRRSSIAAHSNDTAQIGYALMTIRNDGKVGLGTTIPTAGMEVKVASGLNLTLTKSTGAYLSFNDTSNNRGHITANYHSGVHRDGVIFGGGSGLGNLMVVSGSALTNARVGIGTVNPSSTLHVNGGGIIVQGANDTSPLQALLLKTSAASSQGYLAVEGNSAGAFITGTLARATVLASSASNTALQLGSSGTVKMTILGDGKVGIGTNNPNRPLTIVGSAASINLDSPDNTFIHIDRGAADDVAEIAFRTGGANKYFVGLGDSGNFSDGSEFFIGEGSGGSGNRRITLDSTGETTFTSNNATVEIATTSNGTYGVRSTSPAKFNDYYFNGTTGHIRNTSAVSYMSFDSSGNATIPQNLTVQGSLTAQQFITELNTVTIIESSGSTKFGNTNDDLHQFTGSMRIQRGDDVGLTLLRGGQSVAFLGDLGSQNDGGLILYNESGATTTLLRTKAGLDSYMNTTGNFGLGTNNPGRRLDVVGTGRFSGALTIGSEVLNTDFSSSIASRVTSAAAGGISFNGSTANGLVTYGGATTADVEANLTFNGGSLVNKSSGTQIKLNFTDASGTANGYNYFMAASNDGGNKAVHFVNGSNRSSDNGVNTYTIRNDGGPFHLGRVNQVSTLEGSTIVLKTGNVGIGTTSPTSKLHVNGNVDVTGSLSISRTSTYNNKWTFTTTHTAAGNYGGLFIKPTLSTAGIFVRNSSDTDIFTIHSDNVGIGTNNPSEKLHVFRHSTNFFKMANQSQLRANTSGVGFEIANSDSSGLALRVGTSTSTPSLAVKGADGNVGIGRSTPTYKLDVNGDLLVTKTSGNLARFTGAGASSFYISATGQITHTSTTGNLAFAINQAGSGDAFAVDSSALIVKADGNVGIGTATVDSPLHVYGGSANTAKFQSNSGATNLIFEDSSANTVGQLEFGPAQSQLSTRNTSDLRLGVNNITAIYISGSNRNVGIGTDKPTAISGNNQLHIHKQDSNHNYIHFTNTTTGTTHDDGLLVGINGDEQVNFWNREATDMNFATSNGLKMVIQAGGNVGIGETNPAYKLVVNAGNDLVAHFKNAGDRARLFISDEDTSGYMIVQNSKFSIGQQNSVHNNNLTILSSGNVGIGTTSPSGPLHVNTSASQLNLVLGSASQTSTIFNNANAAFGVMDGSTERMRIDASGNVGIGTTSPNQLLDITPGARTDTFDAADADTWADVIVRNQSGNVSTATGIGFYNNSAYHENAASGIAAVKSVDSQDYQTDLAFITRRDGATSTEKMRITHDGNVGIGTANPTNYHADADNLVLYGSGNSGMTIASGTSSHGNIWFADGTSGVGEYQSRIQFNHNGNTLMFAIGDTEIMRFLSSGNVGIGTSSPEAHLHISSSVPSISASLYIEGSGSEVLAVDGTLGRLFSVSDNFSGSLFSANTISGTPVIEAFSDNTVHLGPFSNPIQVTSLGHISGSGISTASFGRLEVTTIAGNSPLKIDSELEINHNDGLDVNAGAATAIVSHGGGSQLLYSGYGFSTATSQTILSNATVINFNISSTTEMNLTSTGLGIGVSPSYPLDVAGNARVSNNLYMSNRGLLSWDSATAEFRVYATSGNKLKLSANGHNSHITIDTSGNVGIGGTPSGKLEVFGSLGNFKVDSTGANATLTRAGNVNIFASHASGVLNLGSNNTPNTVTISGGNVGIGMAGGTPDSRLEVNGTDLLGNFAGTNAGFYIRNNTAGYISFQGYGDDGFIFKDGGNERVRFTSDGKVGIGTATVQSRLHIESGGAGNTYGSCLYLHGDTATNYPAMRIDNATGGNGSETHGLLINNTAAGAGFRVNSPNHSPFIIYGNGRVGIGTDTPGFLLDVQRNTTDRHTADEGYRQTRTGVPTISLIRVGNTVQSPGNLAAIGAGSGTVIGNFSFGATSQGGGGAGFEHTAAGIKCVLDGNFTTNDAKGAITFYTKPELADGDVERMRISSAGLVGIGTTNPVTALQVNHPNQENATTLGAWAHTAIGIYNTTHNNTYSQIGFGYTGPTTNAPAVIAYHNQSATANGQGSLVFGLRNSTSDAAATERVRIQYDGKVGIGTDNPGDYRLYLRHGSEDVLKLYNTVDGQDALISFQNPGGTLGRIQGIDNGGLAFDTGNNAGGMNSNAMFISNAANVGIGTTSPNYPLDIQTSDSPTTLNLKVNASSTTADYAEIAFQLWSGAGSGANTFGGSGTSRPSVVLRAVNENGSSAAGAFVVGTFAGGSNNSTLTEKFRITSAGNVGIGNTSPSGKLEVKQTAASPALFINQDANSQALWIDSEATTQVGIYVPSPKQTTSNVLAIDNANDLTVGRLMYLHSNSASTSTKNLIQVVNDNTAATGTTLLGLQQDSSNYAMFIQNATNTTNHGNGLFIASVDENTTSFPLFIKGNSSTLDESTGNVKFVVRADGKVGIGTKTPADPLHIFGGSGSTINFDTNTTSNWRVGATSTNGGYSTGDAFAWYCFDTSAYKMSLTTGGNLGIGIQTPLHTLHIDGDQRIHNGSLGIDVTPSTTDGVLRAGNDVVAFYSSDERLKENVKQIENPLEKVKQLRGVEFDWIVDEKIHPNEGHDIGVIAQDVEKVLPEIVETRKSGYKAVKYEKMVSLLIESVKEQQKQIEELKSEIQELKDGSSK